ncbi:diheme cytochrome c [Rhodoferax sp. AJA081-3]|uniref:diheme cytochrome c n=1 Tax=Rhodoferax sp. AJA081-3 TaxID=2752316 RepID=UPI001ADF205B|nr:diheme cytochrome c [Rhodoferax sp. AJA081-3]
MMNIRYRPILLVLLVLVFSALIFGRARAGGDHYFAPVAHATVKAECGSCHLAYAPSMLPARSWTHMMTNLDKHFGDDASVDPKLAAEITAYLVANAGDQGGQRYGAKLLRGVSPTSTPQRITELPRWVKEHREVSAQEWKHKDVRSKANCTACHTRAELGYYDE